MTQTKAFQKIIRFLDTNGFDYSTDKTVLDLHSRDASIFAVQPEAIVYPRNKMEIEAIVRAAGIIDFELKSAQRATVSGKLQNLFKSFRSAETELEPAFISLSVRAGGTCMSGGSLSAGVIINMTKYMNAFTIDHINKTAVVEMGVMYRDLEDEMSLHNLFFAGYTSSKDICGIGGMIGNNSSGEKSIFYGATIDNVESLKVILADAQEYSFGPLSEAEFKAKQMQHDTEGELYRKISRLLAKYKPEISAIKRPVPKCASGYRIERIYNEASKTYNLASLFVGSQSTLGIITEVKLRLVESRPAHAMIAIPVDSLGNLPKILSSIMKHRPESVETFDIHTLQSADKFKPTDTARVRKIITPSTELIILAEFAGDSTVQADDLAECTRVDIAAHLGIAAFNIKDILLYQSLWNIRRSSFGVMRDDVNGTKHAVPCIEDIIVPISKFGIFIPELIRILKTRGVHYGFHGHIGDGALRVIPIFDMSDHAVVSKITELSRAVFYLVRSLGGNMSADHSDGIIRSPFLKEFYGPRTYQLFIDIKKIFDPRNLFNPNKKVGGTIKQIEKYIIRK